METKATRVTKVTRATKVTKVTKETRVTAVLTAILLSSMIKATGRSVMSTPEYLPPARMEKTERMEKTAPTGAVPMTFG